MGFSKITSGAALQDEAAIGKNQGSFIITVAPNLTDELGWLFGQRATVLAGDGPDTGWLRIIRSTLGSKLRRNGATSSLSCYAPLHNIGVSLTKSVRCPARVDGDGILIDIRELLPTPAKQAAE